MSTGKLALVALTVTWVHVSEVPANLSEFSPAQRLLPLFGGPFCTQSWEESQLLEVSSSLVLLATSGIFPPTVHWHLQISLVRTQFLEMTLNSSFPTEKHLSCPF